MERMYRGPAILVVTTATAVLAAGCGRLGFGGDDDVVGDDVPPGEVAASLSVGGDHACTIVDREVWCWGENRTGQVGEAMYGVELVPYRVPEGSGATQVVTGGAHTCALVPGVHGEGGAADVPGSITCWGYNEWLQLGLANEEEGVAPLVAPSSPQRPRPIPGLPAFPVQLAAGESHTCARFEDGGVWCWGENTYGALGRGTIEETPELPAATALTGITQLAAGGWSTCAVRDDGAVLCWGFNGNGELGDNTTQDRGTPAAVPGLVATAVTVGSSHACALVDGGRYTCWGINWDGRLGDGTYDGRLVPAAPSVSDGYTAIDAGGSTTCAVQDSGGVACWGSAEHGALGDGSYEGKTAPVAVRDIDNARAVAVGARSACARLGGGTVHCWGYGSFGQLGDGRGAQPTPALVPGLTAQSLASGNWHTCALASDGNVMCWGYGKDGELGDGGGVSRAVPTTVDGSAWAGGAIAEIATGGYHTCARTTGGAVYCWGYNERGQLGNDTTNGADVPGAVATFGAGTAIGIAAGDMFTCAIRTGGTVACWGDNAAGQLGDGTHDGSLIPVTVANVDGAEEITAGDRHVCVRGGSTVRCWGANERGQLGIGTTAEAGPTVIAGLAAAKIRARGNHTCAVDAGGVVSCWGDNGAGMVGDGTYEDRPSPVAIAIADASALGLGNNMSCASHTSAGGGASCWGWNYFGNLGDGTFSDSLTPSGMALAPGSGTVAAIAPAADHVCLVYTDGRVFCAGENADGQLGLGTESRSTVPVRVSLP
jgi:alpha-tubulin suppressor-like RCC1 family protein